MQAGALPVPAPTAARKARARLAGSDKPRQEGTCADVTLASPLARLWGRRSCVTSSSLPPRVSQILVLGAHRVALGRVGLEEVVAVVHREQPEALHGRQLTFSGTSRCPVVRERQPRRASAETSHRTS